MIPLVLWAGRGLGPPRHPAGVDNIVPYLKTEFTTFADRTAGLQSAIDGIRPDDRQSVAAAQNALRACRIQYKRIAFFLEYFFDFAARAFNSPPEMELEEPSMEYDEPAGLQVIEALLFDDDPASKKQELQDQAAFVLSSAQDLHSLLYKFRGDDRQLLESVRLELVRVLTLTLAGWDAPLLKSGIGESYASLSAITFVVQPYLHGGPVSQRLSSKLDSALHYLDRHGDFDSFDRLTFLTAYGLPLQTSLHRLIMESGLPLNAAPALNHGRDPFGSEKLLYEGFSAATQASNSMIALGRDLFFDKRLSADRSRSCATCHQPSRYFTDGLARSLAIDGKSFVPRNAPTLLYASFQHNQFWDGRATTLEEQTASVLASPVEMNASPRVVTEVLAADSACVRRFQEAFPHADSLVSMDHVVRAIASFIRTLAVFDSPLDRYMEGDRGAMTPSQVRGFNLFMGKAGCGTCHFPPLFNGLTPPRYDVTEFASIGVPATGDLDSPVADSDSGRFAVFHVPFQMGSFKTPTLRNVAMTGPYMHNGAFTSLESVVEFYDRGGGTGIGLPVANQTLSARPLKLSPEEKSDIVEFLRALTDPYPSAVKQTIVQP